MDFSFTSAISHSSSRPLEREIHIPPVKARKVQRESGVDVSAFSSDGFDDFDLDLECLSPPASPTMSMSNLASTSEHGLLPHFIPTSPPSPESRDIFLSRDGIPTTLTTTQLQLQQLEEQKRTSQTLPSPKLSPVRSMSAVRGSWPLVRYVGRGTPIDRSRRVEWGTSSNGGFAEGDIIGVAEDGMLFSTVRSTSLDSAVRPTQHSESPEWNYVYSAGGIMTGVGAGGSHHFLSSMQSHRDLSSSGGGSTQTSHTNTIPLPESSKIKIDGLRSDPAEWDSFMQTVLGSGGSPSSGSKSKLLEQPETPVDTANIHQLSPLDMDELREPANGIDMDLGLDAALDLGLGLRGGMNWFELGLLPGGVGEVSGRETPSIYSTPPATPRGSEDNTPSQSDPTSHGNHDTNLDVSAENGSTGASMNTKAEGNPTRTELNMKLRDGAETWWRKVLGTLRKMEKILKSQAHRSRM